MKKCTSDVIYCFYMIYRYTVMLGFSQDSEKYVKIFYDCENKSDSDRSRNARKLDLMFILFYI